MWPEAQWNAGGPPTFAHLLLQDTPTSRTVLGRLLSQRSVQDLVRHADPSVHLDSVLNIVSYSLAEPVVERAIAFLDWHLHSDELFHLSLVEAGGINALLACIASWHSSQALALRALGLLDMIMIQADSLTPEQTVHLVDVLGLCLDNPRLPFLYQTVGLLRKVVSSDVVCDRFMERCKLGPLTRCLDYNSTLSADTELQQSVLSIMMVLMGSSMRRQAVPLAFMQLFELGLSRHVSGQSIVDWLSLLGLMVKEYKHAREFARRGGIRILLTLMRVTHFDLLIHVIRVLKALASTGIIHGSDFSNANKRQVVKFLESCKIYRPPSAAVAPAASIPALPSDASRPQPRRIQVADYEETVERKETLKAVQNAAIRLFDVAADPSKPKPSKPVASKPSAPSSTRPSTVSKPKTVVQPQPMPKPPPIPAAQPRPSAAAKPKPSVTARVSESQKPKPEDPAERARREWDAFVERVRKCLVSLDSEQFFLRVDAAASLRKLLAQREVTPDLCAEVAAKLNPRLDDEDQVIVHSCSCIVPMASKPDRRLRMAEAGTLPLLVKTLLSYNTTVIEHGLKAIAQFASDSEYIERLLNCGLLRHLSVILNNSNESVSSNARIVVGHLRRLGGNKVQVEIDLLQSASVWDRVFRDWKHQ